MITLEKNIFKVKADNIGESIYLIDIKSDKSFKLTRELDSYNIELSNVIDSINEKIYYEGKSIEFILVNNLEERKPLNIDIGFRNIQDKDGKYNIVAYKDDNGGFILKIDFTEYYQINLESISNKIIENLVDIKPIINFIDNNENNSRICFTNINELGKSIEINDIIKNIDSKFEYKLGVSYENHETGRVISTKVKECGMELECNFSSDEMGKEKLEAGIYKIYFNIYLYDFKLSLPIQIPLANSNNMNNYSNIIEGDNCNLIKSFRCEKNKEIYIQLSKLKPLVNIEKAEVIKNKLVLTTTIESEINIDKDIKDISLNINKRNTSKVTIIETYKQDDKNIVVEIEDNILFTELNSGIWDVYLSFTLNQTNYNIRIRDYSDVEDKKNNIIIRSLVKKEKNEYIKAYFTLDDHLALEMGSYIKINKVNSVSLKNDKIIIKGELKSVDDDNFEKGKKNIKVLMSSYNLEEKEFKGVISISIEDGIITKFEIETEHIKGNELETIKGDLFINKLNLHIDIEGYDYILPINADYSKIFIEPIDTQIQNYKYKLLIKILYRIMCKILPIKKNLIVFQSFGGRSYSGNPKYVYEFAKDNYRKQKYVWALRNQFEEVPGPAKTVKIESLKYYYYLSRAEYIVSNLNMQNNVIKRKGAKFIQTWHGTPLKKISFDVPKNSPSYNGKFLKKFKTRVDKWDLLLAQNKYSVECFRSAFKYEGNVSEVGHPLNDILVNGSDEKKKSIKDNIGIHTNKKVILYAPTWRDNGSYVLDLNIEKLYKEFKDEYIVLVKAHYFVNTSFDVQKYKGFVYDVSKYNDIQELALISDILITDYSSVMFDFASTMRPILFYCNDFEYYSGKLRGFYFDFKNEAPGPILNNTSEVVEAIKNIDIINEEYHKKYIDFYNKFAYLEDGKSSERACTSIFNTADKKKKIYFLSFNVFGMGVTGRTVINTAEYLVNSGYEVELISVFGNKKDKYFEIDEKIKITVLEPTRKRRKRAARILKSIPSMFIDMDDEFYKTFSLLTDIKILRKLFSIRNGIVVSTRPGFTIMIMKYIKLRRFKTIGQEHLNFEIHPKNLQKQLKKYYSKLDLLFTLTDADTESYAEKIPHIKDKIIKVPNAIPNLEVNNNIEKKKQIIAAGRLVPQKGFDLLIKASPKIFEKHPDWVLKIYGKGRQEHYLQELINKYGLNNNIFLMGPSKNIEEQMAESEIYVLSSRYEGFGMVIIESMEMGTPVVSFDCPEGPKEIIENEVDGILVENGNLDKLANQVIRLIEDEDLRSKLATNAKRGVKKYYISNIGAIWIEAISKLK